MQVSEPQVIMDKETTTKILIIKEADFYSDVSAEVSKFLNRFCYNKKVEVAISVKIPISTLKSKAIEESK
jgi:hypothetical protein